MKRPSVIFYAIFFLLTYLTGCTLAFLFTFGLAFLGAFLLRKFVFEVQSPFIQDFPPNANVLITGTSTGIGRIFALELAKKGVKVYACVRRKEDGNKLKEDAKEKADNIQPVILDVTDEKQISAAYEQLSKELESTGLWALVNNAGVSHVNPLETAHTDRLREIYNVNVFGVHAVTSKFLPLLRKWKGESRLVFISSMSGITTPPFMALYASSKHAVEALGDGYRSELLHSNIAVSIIEPGSFKSSIYGKSFPSIEDGAKHITAQDKYEYWTFLKFLKLAVPYEHHSPDAIAVYYQLESVLRARVVPVRALVGLDACGMAVAGLLPDSCLDLIIRLFL